MARIEYKTLDQIRHMRRAGLVVADIHQALRDFAAPGVTTGQCDDVVREVIARAGAKSNFLGYHGFPATVCISVNDEVVHGIPGKRRLKAGDIVSFDCGAYVEADGKQWHGDAAFTMIIGDDRHASSPSAAEQAIGSTLLRRRRDLDELTFNAMKAALEAAASGKRVKAIGIAVEGIVDEHARGGHGWSAGIVEEYTGHGIGTRMHQAPEVYNYPVIGRTDKLRPGMVLAIEPMLTTGSPETTVDADEWTVRTVDGSDAAQWEHTIALLEGGVNVLTHRDGGRGLFGSHVGSVPIIDLD